MTNCGKFDLHVDWELKSQPVPVTPPVPTGKAAKPKAASAAAKDAAALAAAAPVFLFEPKVQLTASVQTVYPVLQQHLSTAFALLQVNTASSNYLVSQLFVIHKFFLTQVANWPI